MLLFAKGSPTDSFSANDLRSCLYGALERLGPRKRVLAIPPDLTRVHSQAGLITEWAWRYYGANLTGILPAIGTHAPMSPQELDQMFGRVPRSLFHIHDWRKDVVTLGEVPCDYIREVSEGRVEYAIPMQINQLLASGDHDLILSVGQVVPHEVVGMANYNKNIFVGTGGLEGINRTHFLGAAYGMERIMGRADTPVRRVLNYASDRFAKHLPILYVLTVIGNAGDHNLTIRGLFIGDDSECFTRAADLSQKINIERLDEPLPKVVVYLNPDEFKSFWLGNKSIYRTRMAIVDGGELIVLAPGVSRFGEDEKIDTLIRKYGYVGTSEVMDLVKNNLDLQENLSAAAHLIHGSAEGRFRITYCPGALGRKEVEGVHYGYADLGCMLARYSPEKLRQGFNTMPDGEKVFFIANPALGLWAWKQRFELQTMVQEGRS